ncbi:MAG: hypothetical protein H6948_13755 [Zoogloeaceae bacterium]|nr:hypothetical protein [Zoogloeaceae bacterium]MCP5254654.1 hypothetical protein [Zoogloeaceae bacterium]
MNVMYNDEGLYIVEYPGHDAIEVIDKRLGRGMVIRSEAALRFRLELGRAVQSGEGSEAMDDCVDHFGGLLTQRAIYH